MSHDNKLILVLNTGSSSIKADVYETDRLESLLSVKISGINQGVASLTFQSEYLEKKEYPTLSFDTALQELFVLLDNRLPSLPIMIGYRVVHGGDKFTATTEIDDVFVNELAELSIIDPEHTPVTQRVIMLCRQKYNLAKHIACFDTSFFVDLPMRSKMLPLPLKYFNKGIKRYGFHGLSYTYLLDEFARINPQKAHGKIIMAHLGSGVSLTAINNKKPIDTTMAYSPSSGVMMSTRSGDIDPAVYWRLVNDDMPNNKVQDLLSRHSGLRGVSGLSADMHTLLEQEPHNQNARLAIEVFCYQIKKTIGSYVSALGGCDAIILAGGIGENSPRIRKEILSNLEFMGIEIDEQRNQKSEQIISSTSSQINVYVMHTDESNVIAKELIKLR